MLAFAEQCASVMYVSAPLESPLRLSPPPPQVTTEHRARCPVLTAGSHQLPVVHSALKLEVESPEYV